MVYTIWGIAILSVSSDPVFFRGKKGGDMKEELVKQIQETALSLARQSYDNRCLKVQINVDVNPQKCRAKVSVTEFMKDVQFSD